jgi:hypothetical protein
MSRNTTGPDRLLDRTAILNAIHLVFANEYASRADEAGVRLPTRYEGSLEKWAPRLCDEDLLPFAWYIIGKVEQAWGYSVGLVFHHAGITSPEDQEHALGDLFLGCQGHGVSLADDFSEHLEKAAGVLLKWNREGKTTGPVDFDPSPVDDSMDELSDLAAEVFNEEQKEARGAFPNYP